MTPPHDRDEARRPTQLPFLASERSRSRRQRARGRSRGPGAGSLDDGTRPRRNRLGGHHLAAHHLAALRLASLLAALALVLSACQNAATPSTSPDYSLSLTPSAVDTGLGGGGTVTLQLTSLNGFGGTLRLGLVDGSGHPAYGVSVSPSRVSLAAGGSARVTLAVTVATSVPAGSFDLRLRASGGGVTHSTSLTLTLASTGTGTFAPAGGSPYSAGGHPSAFAVGDFHGGSNVDLAVANNTTPGTATLLLGDGAGGFAPAGSSPYGAGSYPDAVAAGDFDHDGNLDLAVANQGDNTVSVLLGDGAGGLAPASGSPYTVGGSPSAIAVGDFDGNGNLDLAVANRTGNSVSVLLGDGTGGFTPASGSPYGVGSEAFAVAVGDFNRDGNLDLAVANQGDSTVSVLLGDGAGGFAPAGGSPYALGTSPTSLVLGDFDGNGTLDLAVANGFSNTVSVLLGDGAGGFAPASGSPYSVGNYAFSVATGDFDGNGRLDLAVANYNANTVSVLLGQ